MDSAQLNEWELVHVNNATNGKRLITYVLKGVRGSGEILMNGGAALHASKGDKIHILSFCSIKKSKAKSHEPIILLTDENNQVVGRKNTSKNEKFKTSN
ncbi:UNVERIFIED_CONTAM: hypothetical protein GTU68_024188 [Idotea baltica]|nr:hypothetical protein [Idotea baltica]